MAVTIGGATSDRIEWTSAISVGATARSALWCGWYYPTTLTATRKLFGAGAIWGAEIDTTTDELRLRTDNTTDGQWTTTGVDLALDTWKFIAVLNSTLNTGPASAWRVWAGSVDTAPQACTVTVATSPSGNFAGSTTMEIGNNSTPNAAFQGSIEDVLLVVTSATANIATHPFGQAAYGTITDNEAGQVYDHYVLPFWRGELPTINKPMVGATVSYYIPCQGSPPAVMPHYLTTWTTILPGFTVNAVDRAGPRQASMRQQPNGPVPVRR